jgi:hypothetical protein
MQQYFAQINNNNVVVNVAVVTSEFMAENPERYTGTWIETFYDVPSKTYAGVGYTWDGTDFVLPVVEPA